ncbi:DUF6273 domain-containing protein [Bifidobacterium amazonense]|uniref:DUF6273 domain-containing protein n=1 Tax=Bifidobacterium amazonense TaxID=2809027 RepID=A0ABS9VVM9_9BIFI|nr:DUF6273 domain-containing protein [Bifidobacterium amazonense]MCH9276122.1 DUF6273 domain-containing protein [Bifidobacterium amazonense]
MQNLIRDSLLLGAQINITITPAGYYPEETRDTEPEDVQTPDIEPTYKPMPDGAVFAIGGHDIEYRFIPHGPVVTCVPTAALPQCKPFDKLGDSNEWKTSSLRHWLNHEFWLESMPDELKRDIVPTKHDGVEDLVWLPTEAEVFGSAIFSNKELATGEARLFDTKTSRRIRDTNGEPRWWWTRSANSVSPNHVPIITPDGAVDYRSAGGATGGVLPCFNLPRESA